jgi:predicted unusual protein kinase regulating ubiquinone biosynthesis (AarF/ABC1/UbiB family)
MRLGVDGESIRAQLDDIESMLALEVDYLAEADNLRTARSTLEALKEVFVPAFTDRLTTRRVLTMDWVEGAHLGQYWPPAPHRANAIGTAP